ncbi:MAG: hypothetical protein PHI58_06670, partial [Candidatus Omnitrophica bacterium]|nr:hypothetical protein [Candidatus Omnitrophota bacterium]
ISGERHSWLFNLHNFEHLNSTKDVWPRMLERENKLDPNKCAYCGSAEDLVITRIVQKKMCRFAEAHNVVRACKKCNSSKADKDLLDWDAFGTRDKIPRSVMARYLKILYMCHECHGTTDSCAFDKNGNRDLANIRYPFEKPCDPARIRS